jgi:hypothetical protein
VQTDLLKRFYQSIAEGKMREDPHYQAEQIRQASVFRAVSEQTSILALLGRERQMRASRLSEAKAIVEERHAAERAEALETQREVNSAIQEGCRLEWVQKRRLREAEKLKRRMDLDVAKALTAEETLLEQQLRRWEKERMRAEVKRVAREAKREERAQRMRNVLFGIKHTSSSNGIFPKDDFKNLRFKLIPQIISGPWMVRAAVSSTPGKFFFRTFVEEKIRAKSHSPVSPPLPLSTQFCLVNALHKDISGVLITWKLILMLALLSSQPR